MSEVVERMARAMYDADREMAQQPWLVWDDQEGTYRTPYLVRARAALAELREPTLVMFEAGDFQTPSFSEGDPERAARVWRAMVDEALR